HERVGTERAGEQEVEAHEGAAEGGDAGEGAEDQAEADQELAEGHDASEVEVGAAIEQAGEGGAVPGLAGLDGGVAEELAEGFAGAEPAGVGEFGEGALEPDQ